MTKKSQASSRRRKSVFTKAIKYREDFDADVYVLVRDQKTGKLYFYNSSKEDEHWPPADFVCTT